MDKALFGSYLKKNTKLKMCARMAEKRSMMEENVEVAVDVADTAT